MNELNELNDRLIDLLVARATEGLLKDEERELESLLAEAGYADEGELDLAAAAAMNAFALQEESIATEPLPDRLTQKLADDAEAFFEESGATASITDIAAARARRSEKQEPARRRFLDSGRLGWAAAAVLLIALVVANRAGIEPPAPTMDTAMARAELLERGPGTQVIAWASPDSPEFAAVTGDVVWNDDLQEGYLRLAGMPVNDPELAQYQLWIVDTDRDQHPVDGGVFDIPPGVSEVVIPIDSKLQVQDPAAFAITREKPGGVVVSAGPLLVVASPG